MTPPPTHKQQAAERNETAYRLAALILERYNNTPDFWRDVRHLYPTLAQVEVSNIIRAIAKDLTTKADKYKAEE